MSVPPKARSEVQSLPSKIILVQMRAFSDRAVYSYWYTETFPSITLSYCRFDQANSRRTFGDTFRSPRTEQFLGFKAKSVMQGEEVKPIALLNVDFVSIFCTFCISIKISYVSISSTQTCIRNHANHILSRARRSQV